MSVRKSLRNFKKKCEITRGDERKACESALWPTLKNQELSIEKITHLRSIAAADLWESEPIFRLWYAHEFWSSSNWTSGWNSAWPQTTNRKEWGDPPEEYFKTNLPKKIFQDWNKWLIKKEQELKAKTQQLETKKAQLDVQKANIITKADAEMKKGKTVDTEKVAAMINDLDDKKEELTEQIQQITTENVPQTTTTTTTSGIDPLWLTPTASISIMSNLWYTPRVSKKGRKRSQQRTKNYPYVL